MPTMTDRKTGTKRAATYARVSDKSQDTEDKTSISEQISDMEAHCERKSLTITARYKEVGRGWSKNRPEFQRLLADAKRGRFDTIVCWKSDRLSRGMYPAAALMEVVESEAEIVPRVFLMYVREDMGAPAIAKQLTAKGVLTPRDVGRWYDRTVTRILGLEADNGTWFFSKCRHVATEN